MMSQVKIFDTHCHLDSVHFEGKLDTFLEKSVETGIAGYLIPSVTRESWRRIRQLTAIHKICHTALGLHPLFMDQHKQTYLKDLEMALSVGPVSAIGEVGLDYYKSKANRELQVRYFKAQVDIAQQAQLPLVLHCRKAHDEVLQILRANHFSHGGIIHAFNGSENQAERYIDLGFKLGFGGAMTYPRAVRLHHLASSLPLESIVLETDAPDMPPLTCKSSINTPLHLFDNLRSLISLRRESALEIAKQTTQNACEVFKLDESSL